MNTFITSDLHFFHRNVLSFCSDTRPWNSVDEMNQALIDHWNSVISDSDTVWHLGDFSFGNKTKTREVLDQLKGRKMFILGNHDGKNKTILPEYGEVFQYKRIKFDDHQIVLFHFPIHLWDMIDHGSLHFFGHLHGDLKHHGRSMDVGWDAHGRILTLNEAIDIVKSRPVIRRREVPR